jgi:hypothetical protein
MNTLKMLLQRGWAFTKKVPSIVKGGLLNMLNGMASIRDWFKATVVSSMSINAFTSVAKVIPIGSWLKHRELSWAKDNPVLKALRKKDEKKLESLLAVASEETLHQFYVTGDIIGVTPIEYATYALKETKYIKMLLEAIKPENRVNVLNEVIESEKKYVFSLASTTAAKVKVILELIPKDERYDFVNQEQAGEGTVINTLATFAGTKSYFQAFLEHFTPEQCFEILTKTDHKGATVMMNLVQTNANINSAFVYLLGCIPKERLTEFLDFHKQGEKMMMIADILGKSRIKEMLIEIDIPEILVDKDGHDEDHCLIVFNEQWEAEEGFKEKHGDYPTTFLDLEHVYSNSTEIKHAYRSKMLRFHPDKNKDPNAEELSKKIISAHEFFDKPETRPQYLKR